MAAKFFCGLALLLASSSTGAQLTKVELFNNTPVDLCVDHGKRTSCTEIQPGRSAVVLLGTSQWINFGMESHLYLFEQRNVPSPLQAERDGKLYAIPAATTLPATTLPPQPKGFPLVPKRKVDLTSNGAPSNYSLDRTQFRRSTAFYAD